MHAAIDRELHNGRLDVNKLFRSFTRAAAGKCPSPVRVSEKCVEEHTTRPNTGRKPPKSD